MCTAKRVDNLAKKYHMLQFKRLLVFLVVTENPWRRHLILCNKSLSETLTQLTQHPFKKPSTDLGTLEVVLCDLQLSSPKKPWTRKSQHFFWVAEVGGGRVRTWRQKPGCHFHTFSFSGRCASKSLWMFSCIPSMVKVSASQRSQKIAEKLGSNLPLETPQVG